MQLLFVLVSFALGMFQGWYLFDIGSFAISFVNPDAREKRQSLPVRAADWVLYGTIVMMAASFLVAVPAFFLAAGMRIYGLPFVQRMMYAYLWALALAVFFFARLFIQAARPRK